MEIAGGKSLLITNEGKTIKNILTKLESMIVCNKYANYGVYLGYPTVSALYFLGVIYYPRDRTRCSIVVPL